MRWQIELPRDLRLVEITPEEKQRIRESCAYMKDPQYGVTDAKGMVQNLQRDVLERGHLENRRLDRAETLAQFSAWCDAHRKHKRARPYAQEISRTMFAGRVIPRLVGTDNRPVPDAEGILDGFLQDLLDTSEIDRPSEEIGKPLVEDSMEGREQGGPKETASVSPVAGVISAVSSGMDVSVRPASLEDALMEFLVDNPQTIEPELKLVSRGYETDVGMIETLYEAPDGTLVVVETRRGRRQDELIGQLLRYVGWLQVELGKAARGIIVLSESDEPPEYAVAATDSIEALHYRLSFELVEREDTTQAQ